MRIMEAGTLYGVSVGPGDPELITVKALRTIERCPVIAAPQTHGSHTLALEIARQSTDLTGKEILRLSHRMVRDPESLHRQSMENARQLCAFLRQGKDVALLNLGDVSIYSTYSYLAEEVKKAGFSCVMIPGVTSFCACAALLGQSLTENTQPLSIFPGSYTDLAGALDTPGGKVLMKTTQALPTLRAAIAQRGLETKATVVSDCGLPTQRIHGILDSDIQSYFSTVLIRP